MVISRRGVVVGGGSLLAGVLGTLGAERAEAQRAARLPLQFYGGPASAIRPDLAPPACTGGTVHWSGPRTARRIALTFDDGPHPTWTPLVLQALADEDVVATFFVQGRYVRDHPQVHRGSVGRHELANHSWDHPDLGRLDHAAVADQIERCSQQLERTYGTRPRLFRPPYGHLGGSTVLAAAEADLPLVLWSAQLRESRFADHPDRIVADVAAQAHAGAIVLAHDHGPASRLLAIERLRPMIRRLKDDGWSFTTVSDLLTG